MPYSTAYLAQPYTVSPDEAYALALQLIAREALYDSNTTILSPILLYHEAAMLYSLPRKFNFWLKHNFSLIEKCSEVRVVCATGIQESIGCTVEVEYAKRLKLPIRYYSLNTVNDITPPPTKQIYNSLVLFDCFQAPHPYAKLQQQLSIEMMGRGHCAREGSLELA
jgi:hypothetical protein